MPKTLKQLQRALKFEQDKGERVKVKARLKAERSQLRFELAKIRNPGFFRAGRAIVKGARATGRGIVTQGKLIRQQQLREDAEARRNFKKAIKKSTVIRKPKKRKR